MNKLPLKLRQQLCQIPLGDTWPKKLNDTTIPLHYGSCVYIRSSSIITPQAEGNATLSDSRCGCKGEASYEEISRAGSGILSTVAATNALSVDALVEKDGSDHTLTRSVKTICVATIRPPS